MNKKHYIIIAAVIVLALVSGGGYLIWKSQQNKYLNFVDPKLTNDELTTINGKISDLETSVKTKEKSLVESNQDAKADLFKLEMELVSQYRLRGRLLDAKKMALKAHKLLPDNISPWSELVVIDIARLDYNAAEQDILTMVSINPANPQAWRWYFDLAADHLGYTPDQLKTLYKQALDKSSNNVDILALYAGYLEKTNDLLGAVNAWKQAIEKNPAGQAQYQAEITRIQDKLK